MLVLAVSTPLTKAAHGRIKIQSAWSGSESATAGRAPGGLAMVARGGSTSRASGAAWSGSEGVAVARALGILSREEGARKGAA
jgi:hypothetical protein